MKKDPIIVYWAPQTIYWNMFYPEPTVLINDLYKRKNKNSGKASFFACPAFADKFKKTYVFNFPMDASYEWDYTDINNPIFQATSEPYVGFQIRRPPSVDNSPQVSFNLFYMLFCEEKLEVSFTPPYFSKPKYMKYGCAAPGTFDIGQWFRPYPVELTLWEEKGILKFEDQEPLFYAEFLTDRPVILKRFSPTDKLIEWSTACAKASTEIVQHVPLINRYQTFKNSKMNKLIIKEIKENLI